MPADPEVLTGPDSGTPPPVTDSGAKPGGEAEKKPETKSEKPDGKSARDYERELTELRTQVAEKDQVALHWFNKAQGVTVPGDDGDEKPAKGSKSAKLAVDEFDDPEKFVNDFAARGQKAMDDYMAKRGYMAGDQVQKLLDQKLTAATSQAQLLSKYPDLDNPESELFKETQKDFNDMVAMDKSLANNYAVIKIAAKTAAARIKAAKDLAEAGKPKETDAERRTRIAAQQGDTGKHGGAEFEDDDKTLSPEELRMMERFNNAGGGPDITTEGLMKRMRRGVNMFVYDPRRGPKGRFQ